MFKEYDIRQIRLLPMSDKPEENGFEDEEKVRLFLEEELGYLHPQFLRSILPVRWSAYHIPSAVMHRHFFCYLGILYVPGYAGGLLLLRKVVMAYLQTQGFENKKALAAWRPAYQTRSSTWNIKNFR